jgi:hypothetical protein
VNSATGKSSDSAQKSDVQESDIWKVSGNRIYFFNQLRGLQVIDTTNPADPEIVSSLRMPAVGEDMYVLSANRALLVRRDWTNGGTTGLVLVDPSEPRAKVVAELQVPGWYVDSRLVNGRLVLATTEWNTETWQISTRVSIVDELSSKPVVSSNVKLGFSASAMGVGSDYLWFSGTQGWAWDRSRVALFPITGLPKIENPLEIDLGGVIYDKFKIHENGGTLFAVTQSWGAGWRQSTALESYSLADQKPSLLQRLVLIEGESLLNDGTAIVVSTLILAFVTGTPMSVASAGRPSACRARSRPSSSKLSRTAATAWLRTRSFCPGRRAAMSWQSLSSGSTTPPGNT